MLSHKAFSVFRELCAGSSAKQWWASEFRDTLLRLDKEAVLLRKGVLHFAPSSESYLDMVNCDLNSGDLKHLCLLQSINTLSAVNLLANLILFRTEKRFTTIVVVSWDL